jgi:hypothetical protein
MTDQLTGALNFEEFEIEMPEERYDFDPVATGEKISKETIVLEMHIRAPSFSKKIRSSSFVTPVQVADAAVDLLGESETEDAEGQKPKADPSFLHVSQDLLDRKELKKLAHLTSQFIAWIRTRTVPSPIGMGLGFYLLRMDASQEIDAALHTFVRKRRELLDAFEEKYDKLIQDARVKRGEFFEAADYPPFDEIRKRYTVEARYLSYNVPAALERINRDLYEREKQKVALDWATAAEEVRAALRTSFAGLVSHFAERLGTDEATGKPRTFHASAVAKLKDFLDTFEMRDMTDDQELKQIIAKAKDLITGVDAKQIRSQEGLRTALETGFLDIKEATTKMIGVRKRKYTIDDDDVSEVLSHAADVYRVPTGLESEA